MAAESPKTTKQLGSVVIKLKVLTTVERRGEHLMCYVVDSITKSVKEMYLPDMPEDRQLTKGNFYIISEVNVGTAINVKERSKIMHGSSFLFDKSVEDDFVNPKTTTVTEALISPEKKRINLVGVLKGCSEVLVSSNSRRRILYIKPDEEVTDPICEVKLWGDKTMATVPPTETKLLMTNLEMKNYRGKMDANSTTLTEIKTVDEKEEVVKGEIQGASFEPSTAGIYIQDRMLNASEDIMKKIFPALEFVENIEVELKVRGYKVVEVVFCKNTAKKMKK